MANNAPSDKPTRPTRLLNLYERGTVTGGSTGQQASPEDRAENWLKKPALGRPDRDQPDNMQEPAGMSLGSIHGNKMPAVMNVRTRAGK